MTGPDAFPGFPRWHTAAREALTGDASARKYFRLRAETQTAILMDASQVPDSVAPFIRIAGHLRQIGFSAPEILARDKTSGLLLLEDFGELNFARLLEDWSSSRGNEAQIKSGNPKTESGKKFEPIPDAGAPGTVPARCAFGVEPGRDGARRSLGAKAAKPGFFVSGVAAHAGGCSPEELFTLATDVLIALHRHPRAVPEDLRSYHPEKMLEDAELFVQWRTPSISALEKEDFRAAWRAVLPLAHRVPASLLLRDFHVANLMLLPDRAGLRRAGLLDFQDAYRGPVTYDLVSLLEDARRDVPESLRKQMLSRYLAAFPALDREVFATSRAILAAQRHTRVLGIFERLARQEGKLDYRRLHSPRVERLLHHALQHPVLAGVKKWMDRHVSTE